MTMAVIPAIVGSGPWRDPSPERQRVMKVVLFCGGYGMRMRTAEGDLVPKPPPTASIHSTSRDQGRRAFE
jgi:hypothetical protein